MSSSAAPAATGRGPAGSTAQLVMLWGAFALTHIVLTIVNLVHPAQPFYDVAVVYRWWVDTMQRTGEIPGVDVPFVYPLPALVPMLLADVFGGHERYAVAWSVIVAVLGAVALWALTLRRRGAADAPARRRAAWWWLGFTIALGPIAIGRIDAISVPIAILGVVLVRERPAGAGALLALGAWVKVWPGALFLAAVSTLRSRLRILAGAAVLSAGVVVVALVLGGTPAALASFLTTQSDRGLQIESFAAGVLLVAGMLGLGTYTLAYDTGILTYEMDGPGVDAIAASLTPVLVAATAVVCLAVVVQRRRGVDERDLLAPAAIGLVTVLFLANKVGSPQFASWLIAPIILAILEMGPRARVPAGIALGIALLTQVLYPWRYDLLTSQDPAGILLLAARNLLWLALAVWALVTGARAGSPRRSSPTR